MTTFARLVFLFVVCLFGISTHSYAQSYLHEQVAKKYGQLSAKDKLDVALRLEDSAKAQLIANRVFPDWQVRERLEHAIVLFAQVARRHPEVAADLQRVLAEVGKVEYYSGLDQLTAALVAESSSGNKATSKALEQVYEMYVRLVRKEKFNPSVRYQAVYMKRFSPYTSVRDPFYCSQLLNDIQQLAKISSGMGSTQRLRLWNLHEADALVTDHNCEGGWSFDYAKAYELYRKHGELANARKAATEEGDDYLGLYSGGMWSEASGRIVEAPGKAEYWDSFMSWYGKAGLSQAQIAIRLRKAAISAEEGAAEHRRQGHPNSYKGALIAAIRLYQYVGDTAKVRRLSLEKK